MKRFRRGRGTWALVLAAWFTLAAALLAWQLTGPGAGGTVAALVTVSPLLLPLHGLWRARRYTYRWAAVTLVPALAWSLTELVANPAARLAAGIAALLAFLALAALVAALRVQPAAAD